MYSLTSSCSLYPSSCLPAAESSELPGYGVYRIQRRTNRQGRDSGATRCMGGGLPRGFRMDSPRSRPRGRRRSAAFSANEWHTHSCPPAIASVSVSSMSSVADLLASTGFDFFLPPRSKRTQRLSHRLGWSAHQPDICWLLVPSHPVSGPVPREGGGRRTRIPRRARRMKFADLIGLLFNFIAAAGYAGSVAAGSA